MITVMYLVAIYLQDGCGIWIILAAVSIITHRKKDLKPITTNFTPFTEDEHAPKSQRPFVGGGGFRHGYLYSTWN